MRELAGFRYLTFEINSGCRLADVHPRCPTSDPNRYRYGQRDRTLDDGVVVRFWRFARDRGFNGVVLWHLYNEPALALDRIVALIAAMRIELPTLRTHLWTAVPMLVGRPEFEHVELTDYRRVRPDDLDVRRVAHAMESTDQQFAPSAGRCTRDRDWELIIDNRGNWLSCCNDWECAGRYGDVFNDDWDELIRRYVARAPIAWSDHASFAALPAMCRACVVYNPLLHRSALPPPTFGGAL